MPISRYYNKDQISKWFDANYKLLVQRQETSKQNELAERKKQKQIQIDEETQKELIKAQRESFAREQGAFALRLSDDNELGDIISEFNIDWDKYTKNNIESSVLSDFIKKKINYLKEKKNIWKEKTNLLEESIRIQFLKILLRPESDMDNQKKEVFELYLVDTNYKIPENRVDSKVPPVEAPKEDQQSNNEKEEPGENIVEPNTLLHYLLTNCPFNIWDQLTRLNLINSKDLGEKYKPDPTTLDFTIQIEDNNNLLNGYYETENKERLFNEKIDMDLSEKWLNKHFSQDNFNNFQNSRRQNEMYTQRKGNIKLILNKIKKRA